MQLPHYISDNITALLVAFVLLITVILFLAQKFMRTKNLADEAEDSLVLAKQKTKGIASADQSPAAKAFREKLKEISLDLDKD